jgi:pantoate--beta-alanine ligase
VKVVRTVAEERRVRRSWAGRVALVPTMGALHAGHMALVAAAKADAERVIVTIFVNPTQFGKGEDLSRYPRKDAEDLAMLREAGVDMVFMPSVAEMYPEGFATTVRVGGLTDVLDGAARPGHFDGVAQVVSKLLNQAQADVAFFGEKDWQQLAVIRRLAADLDIPTEIRGVPIVRDSDGLALSSRNAYLSADQRVIAGRFNGVLRAAAEAIAGGEVPGLVCAVARETLLQAGFGGVDYVECRDGVTLETATGAAGARVFGAVRIGTTRLIDNMGVG